MFNQGLTKTKVFLNLGLKSFVIRAIEMSLNTTTFYQNETPNFGVKIQDSGLPRMGIEPS